MESPLSQASSRSAGQHDPRLWLHLLVHYVFTRARVSNLSCQRIFHTEILNVAPIRTISSTSRSTKFYLPFSFLNSVVCSFIFGSTWAAGHAHFIFPRSGRSNFIYLTLILLMWRIGRAPNSISIYEYIQQDATLHNLFISGNCSTCFGWYFHPSSGANTTVYTASGICHTVTAICRYRGRVGTGLSVLWVAYATHKTLKPVPTLPR
jgi:hypothetical protein